MVKQYPYILQKMVTVPQAGYNSIGDPIPVQTGWVDISNCRDEAGVGTLVVEDGKQFIYRFKVQLPQGVTPPKAGERIRVITESNYQRCEGIVIYSRADQLHSRLWV